MLEPEVDMPGFDDTDLLHELESAAVESFDDLDFGLITMDRRGTVLAYNANESKRSGLSPERVLGRNFFVEVGPCTNNYMIAERYHDMDQLDEVLDYVFTFRMRPTPVRLRLLAATGSPRQYLAVRSR
jgi:photoactive yellow protein